MSKNEWRDGAAFKQKRSQRIMLFFSNHLSPLFQWRSSQLCVKEVNWRTEQQSITKTLKCAVHRLCFSSINIQSAVEIGVIDGAALREVWWLAALSVAGALIVVYYSLSFWTGISTILTCTLNLSLRKGWKIIKQCFSSFFNLVSNRFLIFWSLNSNSCLSAHVNWKEESLLTKFLS